jgi:hypothetical protein
MTGFDGEGSAIMQMTIECLYDDRQRHKPSTLSLNTILEDPLMSSSNTKGTSQDNWRAQQPTFGDEVASSHLTIAVEAECTGIAGFV